MTFELLKVCRQANPAWIELRVMYVRSTVTDRHFLHISLFRFVFVDSVLLSLVSFYFVFISLISFRFVFVDFVSFRFVSFLFGFALYRCPESNTLNDVARWIDVHLATSFKVFVYKFTCSFRTFNKCLKIPLG
jgi:hypothetical protein